MGFCYEVIEKKIDKIINYMALSSNYILSVLLILHLNVYISSMFRTLMYVLIIIVSFLPKNVFLDDIEKYLYIEKIRSDEMLYLTPWKVVESYYRLIFHKVEKPDLVIAHYKEDLSWLAPYLSRVNHIFLYCKDKPSCRKGLPDFIEDSKITIKYLPNVGREAHSYLYHIINNFKSHAKRTVFTLASINKNYMRKISFVYALSEDVGYTNCYNIINDDLEKMWSFAMPKKGRTTSLGDGYDKKYTTNIVSADTPPLSKWVKNHIGIDIKNKVRRCGSSIHGAIFSASKEEIEEYSIDVYNDLLLQNSKGDSLEAGYYMERVWRFLFMLEKKGEV